MSKSQTKSVQLGFAEDQEEWLLNNRFFPSKIGSKPAWLELKNIPESKDLLCDYCGEPCIFLCQVYAGSELKAHAFHRTIFVFVCRNGKCCSQNQSGNVKVLRSQLPLENSFYPDVPADESTKAPEIKSPVALCQVCGLRGPLICGKCKEANYCGSIHQKLDWKIHKQFCATENELKKPADEILFPEFEIVIEQEEDQQKNQSESEKEVERRQMREYEELVQSGKAGTMTDCDDLKEIAETKEDKTFSKFKKALESYETQVLRYNRHGAPLWISELGILSSSAVPKCENCSGPRTFEFQIMPQMLNELKNYDLDWGVIAVYTCEKDCDVKGKYLPEFCYKQDIIELEGDAEAIDMKKLKINGEGSMAMDSDDEEVAPQKPESKPKKPAAQKKEKQKPTKSSQKSFKESDDW